MTTWRTTTLFLIALAFSPTVAVGQRAEISFDDIPWAPGPIIGDLGAEARIGVPAGCLFTGRDGVRTFMELTENPVSGSERGVVFCTGEDPDAEQWFVIFSFSESGYVKDDERDKLDADAILKSIRRSTDASNEERARRGWGTLSIEGWVTPPHYDAATNNLTWALTAVDSDASRSVNHSVRMLGRGGVMMIDLVASPEQLGELLPTFDRIVSDFQYLPGHRYAEWRPGDKLATYGLTALIAGGAGAAAAKTGLLTKMWKVLVGAAVAVIAGVKRIFRRPENA